MTNDTYDEDLGRLALRHLRSHMALQRVRARLRDSAEALSKLGADLTVALDDDQKMLTLLDDDNYGDALPWSHLVSEHRDWKAAYDEFNDAKNLLEIEQRNGNL